MRSAPASSAEVRASFDGLVRAHEGAVLRVCRSVLRDEHLARDAAQEAFVRLFRALQGERAPAEPRRWLRRAALTSALDLARRREARSRVAGGSVSEAAASRASSPAAEASRAELEARLQAALAELPEGQRTVFALRHEGGLSLVEIAELLGLAPSSVKTQFARACTKLQTRLEPFLGDRGGR